MKYLADDLKEFVANSMINTHGLSRDYNCLKLFMTDRKMVPFMSLRFARDMLNMASSINLNSKSFTYPLLTFTGTADKVVSNVATQRFFDTCSSKTKKKIDFEGAMHELCFETSTPEMVKETLNWFGDRLIGAGDVKKFGGW